MDFAASFLMRKNLSIKDFSHLKPGMIVGIKPRLVIGIPRFRGREAKVLWVNKIGVGKFEYLSSNKKVLKTYHQVYILNPFYPIEKNEEELSKLPTEFLVKMLESIK